MGECVEFYNTITLEHFDCEKKSTEKLLNKVLCKFKADGD